ncbi:MAG: hypothetical protein QOI74_3772 [Micromonosporaceae bacterium]|jgi:hypothetical protein|nr:hypothetical protein [Micromonosporaceae bacterium]
MGSTIGANTGISLAAGAAAFLPVTGYSTIWTAVVVAALLAAATVARLVTRRRETALSRTAEHGKPPVRRKSAGWGRSTGGRR